MSHRWDESGKNPTKEREENALAYVDDQSGLKFIEWADSNFQIRWFVPLEGNENLKDYNNRTDFNKLEEQLKSSLNKSSSPTPIVSLVQGGKGFLVYVPLFPSGKFNGFLVGGFDIKLMLDGMLPPNTLKDYAITIYDENNDILYYRDETHSTEDKHPGAETTLDFYGNKWRIKLQPRSQLLDDHRSVFPVFIYFLEFFSRSSFSGAFILHNQLIYVLGN